MPNKITILQEAYDYLESQRIKERKQNTMTFEQSRWFAKCLNLLEDYILSEQISFDKSMMDNNEAQKLRNENIEHELQNEKHL